MSVVQNLYQIFKIPASFLADNDFDIKSYTLRQGIRDGNVVSIGDNIIFQQIRYINGDYRDHHELFSYVSKLRNNAHLYKNQGKQKEASLLEQKINRVLFVPEIVNVLVDKSKNDFHKIRTKGFDFNGEHYLYLCSGSGQIRRNTATFIREDLRDRIVETINCGLEKKTKEFVLAKYSAYFALAFSSILWVRTPRVCVIKDFFKIIKNENVDFICKDDKGNSIIEKRVMDLELNGADGQGLIDPDFAKLWGEDMDLPYTPCSFVARSCFVKGNLVTFDFKEYARRHNITKIRDRWGVEYNVEDIDVLLSESQFKTAKYYSSWQEYCMYANKGNIHWGVARYNKQHDDDFVFANYQYIQSLELSKEDITSLIKPTVDWLNSVCSGDILPTLLYTFGPKLDGADYSNMFGTAQTTAMKAIVKNIDFLQDSYIQQKIYKNITETINRAKLGKILIRGNYQFCIADPLAQCQSALGLDPVGCLGPNQIWSKFWIDKSKQGCIIDCCRSPMIDVHEHNPMTLLDSDDAQYWFRHINSGIIYNVYDTSCFRQEDSDYDGDIVLTTDNEFFIKGSHKDHNIITYEKGIAKPAKMTVSNITATVAKGFGTGVGGFSNTATIMYAMAAIFNKPEQQDQRNELMTRIKLLREIVGQEIDRIKGADKPFLPKSWKQFESFSPDDTPEERQQKFKHNAMVISKKPYFFRYLYPELNDRYKQFEDAYNQVSCLLYHTKFKKLLRKEDKSPEELNLVRKYQKYSPLITSDCTMNRLCREFESVDFDIKFLRDPSDHSLKRRQRSLLPTFKAYYDDVFSEQRLSIIKSLYKTYTDRRKIKLTKDIYDNDSLSSLFSDDDYSEIRSNEYDQMITDIQSQLHDSSFSTDEFLYYSHKLSEKYSSFNWGFVWDILEDEILNYIPQGKSYCVVRDPSSPIEYLGVNYSLKDITDTASVYIDNIFNLIFGDPEELDDLLEQSEFPEYTDSSTPTIFIQPQQPQQPQQQNSLEKGGSK